MLKSKAFTESANVSAILLADVFKYDDNFNVVSILFPVPM